MASDSRLRVVAFTSGPLLPVTRVFFERLARDPLLDVCGIIRHERTVREGWHEEGWRWLLSKFTSGFASLIHKVARFPFELIHETTASEGSYETLALRTGIPVYRPRDIRSMQTLALIQSLRPQLGVIVEGCIARGNLISIPEHGTLNIRKRMIPEYRGSAPTTDPEVPVRHGSILVTIHYETSPVNPGPVLSEATIPIEACDTAESLRIKADILGARLYHESIRHVALGNRPGGHQGESPRTTNLSPGDASLSQVHKYLKGNAANVTPSPLSPPPWAVSMRLLLQYALVLPLLLYHRSRFIMSRRAPICILYYHLVTNRPVNHMCLPLETFAAQMEFLRRYYTLVSLDKAVERLRSGKNDRIAVSITFDDGYRDNAWAIEYLRYFEIPASFFVSIGHVRDGSVFDHDRERGYEDAPSLQETDVRRLASDGFVVGSHALYHEDFGRLASTTADYVLRESRRLIEQVSGQVPEHFAFPIGQRTKNITGESLSLAEKYYPYVYSAYGGYNFPSTERRHFLRVGAPTNVLNLAMIMDGYVGFRQCLAGNAWGLKTDALLPY